MECPLPLDRAIITGSNTGWVKPNITWIPISIVIGCGILVQTPEATGLAIGNVWVIVGGVHDDILCFPVIEILRLVIEYQRTH